MRPLLLLALALLAVASAKVTFHKPRFHSHSLAFSCILSLPFSLARSPASRASQANQRWQASLRVASLRVASLKEASQVASQEASQVASQASLARG